MEISAMDVITCGELPMHFIAPEVGVICPYK